MNVRNYKIYTEVVWEWNESTQQLEQISEQTESYSGNLALASGPGKDDKGFGSCPPHTEPYTGFTIELSTGCGGPLGPHACNGAGFVCAMANNSGGESPGWDVLHGTLAGANWGHLKSGHTDCNARGQNDYINVVFQAGPRDGTPWGVWHACVSVTGAEQLGEMSLAFLAGGGWGPKGPTESPASNLLVHNSDNDNGWNNNDKWWTHIPNFGTMSGGSWMVRTVEEFSGATCEELAAGGAYTGACSGDGYNFINWTTTATTGPWVDAAVDWAWTGGSDCDASGTHCGYSCYGGATCTVATTSPCDAADACGVCEGDGSSCADCAGTPNGDAVEDCAGTCNGSAEPDCHGTCNGSATTFGGCDDFCCGGDAPTCHTEDCASECNGSAALDDCGVCDGGNATLDCTGIAPSGCGTGIVDDECGDCGGSGPDTNYNCAGECTAEVDCNEDCSGSAYEGVCGFCIGGGTDYGQTDTNGIGGYMFQDCAGACFGDSGNITCPECGDDCGCAESEDDCGCEDYNSNSDGDCCGEWADCHGTCGGTADDDGCDDTCCGGTDGAPDCLADDACGVCGGDGSSCADCAGVPNGEAAVDWCGNCVFSPGGSNPDPSDDITCGYHSECDGAQWCNESDGDCSGVEGTDLAGDDWNCIECKLWDVCHGVVSDSDSCDGPGADMDCGCRNFADDCTEEGAGTYSLTYPGSVTCCGCGGDRWDLCGNCTDDTQNDGSSSICTLGCDGNWAADGDEEIFDYCGICGGTCFGGAGDEGCFFCGCYDLDGTTQAGYTWSWTSTINCDTGTDTCACNGDCYDECNVCAGSGVSGCDNACGSELENDECGVCDGPGGDKDCGTPACTTYEYECIATTGQSYSASASAGLCCSCDGDRWDECGNCVPDYSGGASSQCTQGCDGVWAAAGTEKVEDDCDDCVLPANWNDAQDACFDCDGDNPTYCYSLNCADEGGSACCTPNSIDECGSNYCDECGFCKANAGDGCTQDCAGIWGGSVVDDGCGVCGGACNGSDDGNCTGSVVCDNGCYECGCYSVSSEYGNGFEGDTTFDNYCNCDGAKADKCGTCGGGATAACGSDGTTCTDSNQCSSVAGQSGTCTDGCCGGTDQCGDCTTCGDSNDWTCLDVDACNTCTTAGGSNTNCYLDNSIDFCSSVFDCAGGVCDDCGVCGGTGKSYWKLDADGDSITACGTTSVDVCGPGSNDPDETITNGVGFNVPYGYWPAGDCSLIEDDACYTNYIDDCFVCDPCAAVGQSQTNGCTAYNFTCTGCKEPTTTVDYVTNNCNYDATATNYDTCFHAGDTGTDEHGREFDFSHSSGGGMGYHSTWTKLCHNVTGACKLGPTGEYDCVGDCNQDIDCNHVCNGSAYEDDCGTCVGGDTTLEAGGDCQNCGMSGACNSGLGGDSDCTFPGQTGTWATPSLNSQYVFTTGWGGGTQAEGEVNAVQWTTSTCGTDVCAGTEYLGCNCTEVYDCFGTCELDVDCNFQCGGSATVDGCNECTGGTTGLDENTGCTNCGDATACNWGGDGSDNADCCYPGQNCAGYSTPDASGVLANSAAGTCGSECGNGAGIGGVEITTWNSSECDWNGAYGPDAANTCADVYNCEGVCQLEISCDSICGGSNRVDRCNVCGGDDSTCVNCCTDGACNYEESACDGGLITGNEECEFANENVLSEEYIVYACPEPGVGPDIDTNIDVTWTSLDPTYGTYDCSCDCNQSVDCEGVCGGSLTRDTCGVCDGDDTTCDNCNDETACNYADAVDNSTSEDCRYPGDIYTTTPVDSETQFDFTCPEGGQGNANYENSVVGWDTTSSINYDCGCNCIDEGNVDCAGVCGGSSILDNCGQCRTDNQDEYWDTGCVNCTAAAACNYDTPGVVNIGSDDGCTWPAWMNLDDTGNAVVCNGSEGMGWTSIADGGEYSCDCTCTSGIDCNFECNGTAVDDDCGVCTGGTTTCTDAENGGQGAGVCIADAGCQNCNVDTFCNYNPSSSNQSECKVPGEYSSAGQYPFFDARCDDCGGTQSCPGQGVDEWGDTVDRDWLTDGGANRYTCPDQSFILSGDFYSPGGTECECLDNVDCLQVCGGSAKYLMCSEDTDDDGIGDQDLEVFCVAADVTNCTTYGESLLQPRSLYTHHEHGGELDPTPDCNETLDDCYVCGGDNIFRVAHDGTNPIEAGEWVQAGGGSQYHEAGAECGNGQFSGTGGNCITPDGWSNCAHITIHEDNVANDGIWTIGNHANTDPGVDGITDFCLAADEIQTADSVALMNTGCCGFDIDGAPNEFQVRQCIDNAGLDERLVDILLCGDEITDTACADFNGNYFETDSPDVWTLGCADDGTLSVSPFPLDNSGNYYDLSGTQFATQASNFTAGNDGCTEFENNPNDISCCEYILVESNGLGDCGTFNWADDVGGLNDGTITGVLWVQHTTTCYSDAVSDAEEAIEYNVCPIAACESGTATYCTCEGEYGYGTGIYAQPQYEFGCTNAGACSAADNSGGAPNHWYSDTYDSEAFDVSGENSEATWNSTNCNVDLGCGCLHNPTGTGEHDHNTEPVDTMCYAGVDQETEVPNVPLCPRHRVDGILECYKYWQLDCQDGSIDCGIYPYIGAPVLEAGCSNELACNYGGDAVDSCNLQSFYDFGTVDETCCVFPVSYCVADGSAYSDDLDTPTDLGFKTKCDVNPDESPFDVGVYCPNCTSDTPANDAPVCTNNYTDAQSDPYTCGSLPGLNGAWVVGQCAYYNPGSIPGIVDVENITSGRLIYSGEASGASYDIANTNEAGAPVSFGEGLDIDGGIWQGRGCMDPGALNYGIDGQPLYWPESYEDIYTEGITSPVTSCIYCEDGYSFYWHGAIAANASVDGDAFVTDGGCLENCGTFQLDEDSLYIDNTVEEKSGFCVYTQDVTGLESIAALAPNSADFTSVFTINTEADHGMNAGQQQWDANGRLIVFEASSGCDETSHGNGNPNSLMLNGSLQGTSIGLLTGLQELNLSCNELSGEIPLNLETLTSLYFLDLSFNDLTGFEAGMVGGVSPTGLCYLLSGDGQLSFGDGDYNLRLMDNSICPELSNSFLYTIYPECLAPTYNPAGGSDWNNMPEEQQQWAFDNLGWLNLPNYELSDGTFTYSDEAQNTDDCVIRGCTSVAATNYWELATVDNNNCIFDPWLHFPWHPGPSEGGYGDPDGSFGGGMTVMQMIQALHANIYGLSYNTWGTLDVTAQGTITTNQDGITIVEYNQDHEPINQPAGDMIIDAVDGWWLVAYGDSPGIDQYDNQCIAFENEFSGVSEECAADARPLDFIHRITWLMENGTPNASLFYGAYFPTYFADISMQSIEYYEDYDINNDGVLNEVDATMWENIGRIDIANYIRAYQAGQASPPPPAPDIVEWWEDTLMVSMSYSTTFLSEAEVGMDLFPSGQYKCSDSGDSTVCYEDPNACGLLGAIDDCIPCGNGGGYCIPLTINRAAEGYDKITNGRQTSIKYFYNGNSPSIEGSELYTASLADTNERYYYSVTAGDSALPGSVSEFDVAWGHIYGSGSITTVSESNDKKGASEAVYKQYASMLLGDNEIQNGFLISSGSDVSGDGQDGTPDKWIYILNFKRKNFKDRLGVGNWTLELKGKHAGINKTIKLTDNSNQLSLPPYQSVIGRRFDIISGSFGVSPSEQTNILNRYGWFYPDMGMMVFGEKLSTEIVTTTSPNVGIFNHHNNDQNQLYPLTSSNSDGKNALRFVNCLRNVGSGNALTIYGVREETDVVYLVKVQPADYNFTSNFTTLSGSGRNMINDDIGLRAGFPINSSYTDHNGIEYVAGTMTMEGNNSTTYITQIFLWDEHGTCVAIASLSKAWRKDFNREIIIKVKLTF